MFWRTFAWTAVWIAVWIGTPASVAAETKPLEPAWRQPAEAFLKSAEALYSVVLKGDMKGVLSRLNETETGFLSLPVKRIASAEGVEALARSIARMKRASASVSPDAGALLSYAAEIRLAADDLAHPDNPLWHRYQTLLRGDIEAVGQGISAKGTSPAALAGLDRLKAHYHVIRTAALLRSETYPIERADSVLRYAERVLAAPHPDPSMLTGLVPNLTEAADGLFPGKGHNREAFAIPMAGPAWGWSALMGTFIVSILSWAGWQRYRGIDTIIPPRENLPPERHEHR